MDLQEHRKSRLIAAIDFLTKGNRTHFGKRLGYRDGAFVRQMLDGSRPITENTVQAIEALSGLAGWFNIDRSDAAAPAARLIPLGGATDTSGSEQESGVLYGAPLMSAGAFAIEIGDLSMAPELLPGDHVIAEPAINPLPGDFVVARSRGQLVVRKFRARGSDGTGEEQFDLAPLNDDFETFRNANASAQILATVVEQRRYRRRLAQ